MITTNGKFVRLMTIVGFTLCLISCKEVPKTEIGTMAEFTANLN